MTLVSIGTPAGPNSTTCGYCSAPGERSQSASSYLTAGLDARTLSCTLYQRMIDRGWRRSGTWCYKPNLRASCCPQYTIRLDAVAFKPSKSQRKLVNRWNRYVISGTKGGAMDIGQEKIMCPSLKPSKATPTFSLPTSIHASEDGFYGEKSAIHRFQTTLDPASYTDEKYALFDKYQKTIHHDHKSSPSDFRRFLVDSPLQVAPIPYTQPPPNHLPTNYGSYHQLYRLDGQLIAIGVIDILPACVSSVYFIYDQTWEQFSLGKLSALREVSLACEMHNAGAPQMGFLYMGFYIHSCQKMRYKGDYSPSYLADPETYAWFPLSTCLPLLDKYRYACFQNPDHFMNVFPEDEEDDNTPMSLDLPDLAKIQLVIEIVDNDVHTLPINMTPYWAYEEIRKEVLGCVHGLGTDISKEIAFLL
ncbi:hypothetical protein L208DRAFT_1426287 [Tricholoma matsutake]|nr:hypothetical protein L208DRAFT_1426287 [Tricholoma matsutake 945]